MFRYVLSMSVAVLIYGWLAPLNGLGAELFPKASESFGHPSLREQMSSCDSVMVATWSNVKPSELKADTKEKSNFTVIEVIKDSTQESEQIKVGKILRKRERPSDHEGQRFLVFGHAPSNDEEYRYQMHRVVMSDALLDYLRRFPGVNAQPKDQLAYFVNHLESSDPMVAQEAYHDLVVSIKFEQLSDIRDELPPEKLRQWLTDPQTDLVRVGAFSLLLASLGDETDIPLLKDISLQKVEGYRSGVDRVFSGYLFLAGERGLEVLEDAKLKDKTVPFSETYATMLALRFMWTYGDGRISKDRLRQSMRILLDRPEVADLVIIDLCKWQDWTVSDRLMELYGTAGYDIPSTKRVIARFFLTAEAAKPKDANEPLPSHVLTAQKHLKTLREKDPETVKAAEEFFLRFPEFLGG